MFPKVKEEYNLQSKVFGHRFKQSQSVYEYALEFFIVVFSKKILDNNGEVIDDMFPLGIDRDSTISYTPNNNVGLKRFIFFNKSKQESRFEMDNFAYERHLEYMEDIIDIEVNNEYLNKKYIINAIQNLLYGFGAVIENRSWFAQSLLPICEHALTAEIMGVKSKRNKKIDELEMDKYKEKVDTQFETNRYNFMCRGGEVYYLHILKAINDYPEYKEKLEKGLRNLLGQFKEIEKVCQVIQTTWENRSEAIQKSIGNKSEIEKNSQEKVLVKNLGCIPDGFDSREKNTLLELINILNSEMHPFEKLEVLSQGIILQIITMTFNQARKTSSKNDGIIIYDINCYKGKSNDEMKKLAYKSYMDYEQDIRDALYDNLDGVDFKGKTEKEVIDDAINDSIKVYKKIGKKVGIIRPINEKYTRFTMSESILKFLVTSLVEPNSKMTLDRFLEKIYLHFNIVIGKEEYLKAVEDNIISDIEIFDKNKEDMQVMLKESGFLRELSDSTSIVENPYRRIEKI